MDPHGPQRGFTLIELLVVIAIIAILAVVVVLTLNPAELLRQSRDANRLSDLATLSSAVNLYNTDQSGNPSYFLGNVSSSYLSIPDPTATSTNQCQGLGMGATPGSYLYGCSASSTYRAVSSQGWLPVNFSTLTAGSPISSLPVDPVNQTSSGLYYTYNTNGTVYDLSAFTESQKYAKIALVDGGNDPSLLEAGSGIATLPDLGRGLVGYWPLNEGTGSSTVDWSGGGNNGTWTGTASGTSGYYSSGKTSQWAGYFNGVNDKVSIGGPSSFVMGTSSFSFGVWAYPTTWPTNGPLLVTGADNGTSNQGFTFRVTTGNQVLVMICDGATRPVMTYTGLPTSTWSFLFVTINRATNIGTAYLNGSVFATESLAGLGSIGQAETLTMGSVTGYTGEANDVRIYDRALSASEVQQLYNAEK
ncbi:MAG TPA: LamG-like jellyroll fold domain-containing protein [Candidatus Paceibacterota bacterium]|nr:LamG-like jellyroll fold domain-containing protein [Candidatus Paceibacterota bacterium]